MTEEPGFSITPTQVVSLDLELAALAGATRGAQLLADLQARKVLEADQEREIPSDVFSILALVTERIGQLRRVMRHEENPAHLWAPHNAVEDPAVTGEFVGDVVLFPWGSHRAPLIMWGCRTEGIEAPRQARGRKPREPKGAKARDAAPEPSSDERQEPKEAEPPTSEPT
jgi:hypothetical protein